MGGRPPGKQLELFSHCTHAILLLREDKPDDTMMWQRFIHENSVVPLAQLFSIQQGETQLSSLTPILEGTITGLERHQLTRQHGPTFEQLVELVAQLFRSYTREELTDDCFQRAPGELINLETFIAPEVRWRPEMLPYLLDHLPPTTALALYGVAPAWVYAVVAAASGQQVLAQYDPKLPFGWVQPLAVETSLDQHPDTQIELRSSPSRSQRRAWNISSQRLFRYHL